MTKTIDEQLERLASAQERSAKALEGIFEAVANFKFEQVGNTAIAAGISEDKGTGANDKAGEASKEVSVKEAAEETPTPEGATEETTSDSPEDAVLQLPDELTNDTLRGFARDLMEKEGKTAVFEVLADIGTGYKAVGEVPKDDLPQAHELMIARLKG
jgi:hypothetical protein